MHRVKCIHGVFRTRLRTDFDLSDFASVFRVAVYVGHGRPNPMYFIKAWGSLEPVNLQNLFHGASRKWKDGLMAPHHLQASTQHFNRTGVLQKCRFVSEFPVSYSCRAKAYDCHTRTRYLFQAWPFPFMQDGVPRQGPTNNVSQEFTAGRIKFPKVRISGMRALQSRMTFLKPKTRYTCCRTCLVWTLMGWGSLRNDMRMEHKICILGCNFRHRPSEGT